MKRTLTILACFFVASMLAVGCANGQTKAPEASNQKSTETKLPLGIEIPTLRFAEDVQRYMREVISAPLPADYVLPDDVKNAGSYGQSVAKVNEHFPEFEGLESGELLRKVKEFPLRYQEFMLEAKAVRELYHPGSQPKPAQ